MKFAGDKSGEQPGECPEESHRRKHHGLRVVSDVTDISPEAWPSLSMACLTGPVHVSDVIDASAPQAEHDGAFHTTRLTPLWLLAQR